MLEEGENLERYIECNPSLSSSIHHLSLDLFVMIIFSDCLDGCHFLSVACFLAKSVSKTVTFGQLEDPTYGPAGLCQMGIIVN